MRQEHLTYLVCPACQIKLDLHAGIQQDGHVMEGALTCADCGVNFPIIGGIPRFVGEREWASREKFRTAENFGRQWKFFKKLVPLYRKQFLDWVRPVSEEFFRDKVILDAGCGKGRHLHWASEFGARIVIGADLSLAVEASFEHHRHKANVLIIQADLTQLPVRDEFDYIYSIGVLHHLPSPDEGFAALTHKLKPGGRISVWVYGRENNGWVVYGLDPIRRNITSRLPLPALTLLAWLLTLVLWLALKLIYKPASWLVPSLARHLFYYDYLSYIMDFGIKEITSIAYDQLSAPVTHYITRERITEWYQTANLRDVVIEWHNANSWRGHGVRLAAEKDC